MKFNDKVAIVLGGIRGIGKAIALDLLKSGVKVAITWFDWKKNFDSMNVEFLETGTEYMVEQVNLLDTRKISCLIRKVIDKFGRLDILINNMERGGWPVVHGKYLQKQWDIEIGTTLRAKQWMFENALPYLKASKNGLVINLSSIAGIVGRSGPTSLLFNEGYSAANRGISLLTETWARLGAPEVRVNELMLGIFDSRHGPGTRGWEMLDDFQRREIIDHTLVGRVGRITDILMVITFLLKSANFMTGSVIRLDGGYILGGERVVNMPIGVV